MLHHNIRNSKNTSKNIKINIDSKKKADKQSIASKLAIEKAETSGEETYNGSNQSITCPNCSHIIPFHNEDEIKNRGVRFACIPCKCKVSKEIKQ